MASLQVRGTSGNTVIQGIKITGAEVGLGVRRAGQTEHSFAQRVSAIAKFDTDADGKFQRLKTNLRLYFDPVTKPDSRLTYRISVLRALSPEEVSEGDRQYIVEDREANFEGIVLVRAKEIEPFEVADGDLLFARVDKELTSRLVELGLAPEGNSATDVEGQPRRVQERR